MYHWASRRIETHVKICVLAQMIERIAELQCGKPWHKIRRILEALQVTEIFKLNHRVLMRNERPPGASKIFKYLKNHSAKAGHPPGRNRRKSVDTR
jgi:hypothetical protein